MYKKLFAFPLAALIAVGTLSSCSQVTSPAEALEKPLSTAQAVAGKMQNENNDRSIMTNLQIVYPQVTAVNTDYLRISQTLIVEIVTNDDDIDTYDLTYIISSIKTLNVDGVKVVSVTAKTADNKPLNLANASRKTSAKVEVNAIDPTVLVLNWDNISEVQLDDLNSVP